MTLLHPMFLIPALLCLAGFVIWRAAAASDDWARVMAKQVLDFLRPATGRTYFNFALLALAIVLAALASPALRADSASSNALDEGILVMVDVSKSMGLEDVRPSRINVARAIALQISAEAGARPTALIAYAGDAYLLQPFAVDRRQVDAFAAALEVGLVPQDGSNLERALALASTVIEQSEVGRVRLVIVGDGGGFGNDTGFIARGLAERGHRVDVVLTADPATTTPVAADVAAMQAAAGAGGGVFVAAGPEGAVDLGPLNLDAGLLQQGKTFEFVLRSTEWRNLSHFLLLLAVPALLLAFRQVRS